jgi:hypothetical protein
MESCCFAPAEMWFQSAMTFIDRKKWKTEQIGFTEHYFQKIKIKINECIVSYRKKTQIRPFVDSKLFKKTALYLLTTIYHTL